MEQLQSKQVWIDPQLCEKAEFAYPVELGETGALLLTDQIRQRQDLLTPLYGIESSGVCHVFVGAYQLGAFKDALRGKKVPVLVGLSGSYTPAEITQLMLSPKDSPTLNTPEGDYLYRANTIIRLKKWFAFSDQQIADYAGMNRATVTQTRKLLELHSTVRRNLSQGHISFSIARELLSVDKADQLDIVKKIIRNNMNISAVRKMLKGHKLDASPTRGNGINGGMGIASGSVPHSGANTQGAAEVSHSSVTKSADVLRYEQMINETIGYPASIEMTGANQGSISMRPFDDIGLEVIAGYLGKSTLKHKVRLVIEFDDLDEFEAATEKMVPSEES